METTHDEMINLKEDITSAMKSNDFFSLQKLLVLLRGKKMTTDLLRSTLFGKIVATLCIKLKQANENNIVQDQIDIADDILKQWKSVYQKSKQQKQEIQIIEKDKIEKTQILMDEKLDQAPTDENSQPSGDAITPEQIKLQSFDEAQLKYDRKHLERVGIPYRDNMRLRFFDILSQVEFEIHYNKTKVLKSLCKASVTIEKALFNKYRLPNEYAKKARSLIFNLGNNKNPLLRYRILFGELSADKIIEGGPELFQTDDTKNFIEKAQRDHMLERRTDWMLEEQKKRLEGEDGIFQCFKCRSKKTTFYQMQTRSADEPMTNFCCCLNCGKRWRC